jgi:hypothetical protein
MDESIILNLICKRKDVFKDIILPKMSLVDIYGIARSDNIEILKFFRKYRIWEHVFITKFGNEEYVYVNGLFGPKVNWMWACFAVHIYNNKIPSTFEEDKSRNRLDIRFENERMIYITSEYGNPLDVFNFMKKIIQKPLSSKIYEHNYRHYYRDSCILPRDKDEALKMLYTSFVNDLRLIFMAFEFNVYQYSKGISCRVCGNKATLQEEGKEKYYCSEDCYFNK